MKTYISLFSSAGVGCYGFKENGYECVATNELIERRLDIQRFNKKCKYDSGYICGDLTSDIVKKQLFDQLNFWRNQEKLDRLDVVIATPPCQGMSVANHKKNNCEIIRNSLVIESIKIINLINPKFFVFENVPAFMKTICTDIDGKDKSISEALKNSLGGKYSYIAKIINFKNYGACSSRQRTLVIGVSKDLSDEISPLELFPNVVPVKTLRSVIGDLPSLKNMGEISQDDIYHSFRAYPSYMREWINNLKEGMSAFDNEEDIKKPHQIIDGKLIINKQKNGDKYKRQYWDKVGPCIHTRNDQLASQNTIHPQDDRVFSIRELMKMMTVPASFKWVKEDLTALNALSLPEKQAFLKKEEIKIRQSLGEAVPTVIFSKIAQNISSYLSFNHISNSQINELSNKFNNDNSSELICFIKNNPLNLSLYTLSRIAELSNSKRTDRAAYYTNKTLITEILRNIEETSQENVSILEPSVGVGNFVPLIIKKFEDKNIKLDLVDIDKRSLEIAKAFLEKINIPKKVKVTFINSDFLLTKFEKKYDYVIGNPPFTKLTTNSKYLLEYKANSFNKVSNNLCSFFLDKSLSIASYVALVLPKFVLNTAEFSDTRNNLYNKSVQTILDFGEKGFPGVLVETIGIIINTKKYAGKTKIVSYTKNIELIQNQKYIFDKTFPYWIIYRNQFFDHVLEKLHLNVFSVFRDRQITSSMLKEKKQKQSDIRVIKSRNISDNGCKILDIPNYDSYISIDLLKKLSVYSYIDRNDVYLTPNMTYKPRVIKKEKRIVVNGSVAILLPKKPLFLTKEQLAYFSSDEYRAFYQIARNYQTRSLNVDSCSVFFYGVLRIEENKNA